MGYAEVAVNAPVTSTFHYAVPQKISDRLRPGHLVRVSFGTAMQPAIVVALHPELPEDLRSVQIKSILELLDPTPVMGEMHLRLAAWMSQRYLAPIGDCLWLLLPPGLTGSSVQIVSLRDPDAVPEKAEQAQVVALLREHGNLTRKQIATQLGIGQRAATTALNALQKGGIISIDSRLSPPTARPRMVRTARLAVHPAALTGQRLSPKQRRIVKLLAHVNMPLDATFIAEETGTSTSTLTTLEKRGLIERGERIAYRDSLADRDFVPAQPVMLTQAQRHAWEAIHDTITAAESDAFLLHGVTGSGKTEIYLQAIAAVLDRGRQAIFLVPEIALTPQTIQRVAARFPDQVAVVHGSLSVGERYDTWQRARSGQIKVIVGTRSALFTPLPDVGLIILDEEHDHSYKHAPPFNPPYYDARHVAEKMADLNDAVLILGSATPALETFYRAQHQELGYLHLPQRIIGHRRRVEEQASRAGWTTRYQPDEAESMTIDLPPVQVIDMREELKAGNLSMFSRALHSALTEVLQRGEQAMLLLNRRGQASYVFCRDCGFVLTCPRCDTPLTYHRTGEALRCHHCGHQEPTPSHCPNCRSERIRYFGAGTQQVEQALAETFAEARVLRWDADTVDGPDAHETILARFAQQEADILLGTQMIAKGLDLPFVTLVGVVSADPGLMLPDFRADERTFALLTQVAGRAGRGVLGGSVIVQTYQPEHPAIAFASQHDYTGFYAHEIVNRQQLGYPPFRRMARILVQSSHPVNVQREAERLADTLRQRITAHQLTDTTLIGPAPCFFRRIDRNYRWHILIRSQNPAPLLKDLQVRPGIYIDIDALDIL